MVWNVADGFPLSPGTYGIVPGGVLGVAFTSDGRLVSVGRDSTIRIRTADGKAAGASPAYGAR